jgi:hypothetical protein
MRILVALAALAVVVPLSGCHGPLSNGDTHQLEVRGTHTAFDVEVPDDWGILQVLDANTCGSVTYEIAVAAESRLVIEAVPTSCAEAEENTEIGNGRHGVYRTIADVPEPREKTSVDTDLGTATVFTQTYYECTNSCDNWNEPVAIISLAAPVDAGYPTLVVRGEKELVSRDDLEDILKTLAAPIA